ncbi:hypothetical protein B0I35DRAFT_407202 [Stachybotrys elegans]|uniref:Uncharacterized protein n=1 Tax=Stachybotrys elegans TaxID=80388 RepID=A0A8K0WUP6_9HYPO|nr:hypothetical protein B0I35DRAFT_407202 [Stachybotrys elegans]
MSGRAMGKNVVKPKKENKKRRHFTRGTGTKTGDGSVGGQRWYPLTDASMMGGRIALANMKQQGSECHFIMERQVKMQCSGEVPSYFPYGAKVGRWSGSSNEMVQTGQAGKYCAKSLPDNPQVAASYGELQSDNVFAHRHHHQGCRPFSTDLISTRTCPGPRLLGCNSRG